MKPSAPLLIAASALLINLSARADVKMPPIFGDSMVLQQDQKLTVWGTADPGEEVTVSVGGSQGKAVADSSGKWMVKLDPLKMTSEPMEMTVTGKNTLVFKDVLVGDVWVCSGQSNMEWVLKNTIGAEEEIAASSNNQLRQFRLSNNTSPEPIDNFNGKWTAAGPETSGGFTAVGYYFGKELQKRLNKPIGLLHTSWGGTPVEAWTSSGALDTVPDLKASKDRYKEDAATYPQRLEKWQGVYADWAAKYGRKDPGTPDPAVYAGVGAAHDGWKTVALPGEFSGVGLPDSGVVWLSKKVSVPESAVNQGLRLDLGLLQGFDEAYWNGVKVGETTPKSGGVTSPRTYYVPSNQVKSGDAVLSIRLFSPVGGAAVKQAGNFRAGAVQLNGEWLAKEELSMPALPTEASAEYPQPPSKPTAPQNLPTYLFNAMIHPVLSFPIKGAIWYQGEANAGRAWQYRTAFPLMISDWRNDWKQGDFPFYFCQLANFTAKRDVPGEDGWAELRDAQASALELPNTGMAVLIDIGESDDIHPRNKKDAGERLAKVALAKTYGENIPWSGPRYRSMAVEGDKVKILFDNADGGLIARPLPESYVARSLTSETKPYVPYSQGSELQGFAICGADKQWKWAQAKIDGDAVMVWSPEIPSPVAVRYAWAANPTCNLYNGAGLPAVPFRTDDFPAATLNNKF